MEKPKILIDVYYLHVAQTGIRTYIISLCEEILRRKETAFDYIITPDFDTVRNKSFFKGNTSKWKNMLFQLLYFFRKQISLPILSYYHKADLVFSPDILSPIWGRGKKVSVIHDTFFWDTPIHYQRLWLKYFLYFLEKGLRKNGEIITITQFSKMRIQDLRAFKSIPIRVVYQASGITRKAHPSEVNSSVSTRYFLHVGVLEKRKNLGMLITAFGTLVKQRSYEDIRLVLVGQRAPRETIDAYDELTALATSMGLTDKVYFMGYVAQEKLATYFQNALGYVFPSANEGFGLPVLEAFSFGLPVIISRQGALMEVAGDAALVLEKNDSEALFQSMKLLADDAVLRKELGEKGRIRLKEFSTEKFFLSLEQAFKEILNG
ncbi:glycosyltransferase family 4 protein [Cognataquiflexum rubidum]|uniref:glycosyltransferase family 4 protein n=1 Tax=Cognataquiflexum rubidum TaxID=2922273 RepID=UPI001F13EDD6|nr:glycosyltransferase family 1 protein [Cognataquiflexum rubidum]MCH6234021.1 glycosyltransferase family 4 protein [Cognataquiflexum rubidum]